MRFCFLNRRPNDRRAHRFFGPFFLFSSIIMIVLSIATEKLMKTISNYFSFSFSFQQLALLFIHKIPYDDTPVSFAGQTVRHTC